MLVSFDTAVTAQMWRLRGWNKFRQPFKVVKVVMWSRGSPDKAPTALRTRHRWRRQGKAIGWSKPHTHSPTQLIWRYLDIK